MTETMKPPEATNLPAPKRKPGRPAKIPGLTELQSAAVADEVRRIELFSAQPLLAARFREAAPIGFANRAETSAITSQDGRMHVSVDWTRRVVVVLTKEGNGTCETLIPLENVKSMRPMLERLHDAG